MAEPNINVTVRNDHVRSPTFDGVTKHDADIHWLLFTDFLTEAKVAEENKISKFRITLIGEPRMWFETNKDSFTSLDVLEAKFKAEFSPVTTRAEYLKQFQQLTIQPSETLIMFKKRLIKIAIKAKIQQDEELITTQFVAGLPASIRNHVRARRDANIDDAFKTAQAVLVDTPTTEVSTSYAITNESNPISGLTAQMQRLMYANDKGSRSERTRSTSRSKYNSRQDRDNRSASRSRQGRSERREQSRSSSRSHSRGRPYRRDQTPRGRKSSRDKAVSFRSKSRSRSPVRCFYCNKSGHIFGNCRLLLKHLQEGKIKPENFQ